MFRKFKNVLLSEVAFLLCLTNLSAQGPDTSWTKTFGGMDYDYGSGVQETSDSGYIVVGFTYSFGVGYDDVYLIKTDANGDSLWTKTFGGTGYDAGRSVQQTSDDGYIVTGLTDYYSPGTGEIYLIKTNTSGDTLWTRKFGGAAEESGYSVKQTVDGGYIVVGSTNSFGSGSYDIYLIKTNTNGDTTWTKTYGGMNLENAYSVQQTSDGGYIIAGMTESFGAGGLDVYLIKTDANGDSLWTKTFGGVEDDWGTSVQETSDNGFIIVGSTYSFGLNYQIYVIKTNPSGDTLWTKTLGGDSIETGESLQQTSDSGYIITGVTGSFGAGGFDVYLIRMNSSGDTIWAKTYGGPGYDGGYSIDQTSDGGYIIAGDSDSYGAGAIDIYLIKTEPDIGIEEEIKDKLRDVKIPGFVYGNILKLVGINKHTNVKIFDILGRDVLTQRLTPKDTDIKLNNLCSGIYFLQIKTQLQTKTEKIIILK